MNKRKLLSFIIIGILAGASIFITKQARSQKQDVVPNNYAVLVDETESSISDANPTTLTEAWDIAFAYAKKWSDDAGLIYLTSTDARDPDAESYHQINGWDNLGGQKINDFQSNNKYEGLNLGLDGKRRAWQATFTSEKVGTELNIEITDGAVTYASQDGIHTIGRPVLTETPLIDSPEALQRALDVKPDLRMSVGKGVGIHFLLEVDGKGEPQVSVIGSHQDKDQLMPFFISINQKTGATILTPHSNYSIPAND